jgi:hypothetical protein
VVEPEIGGGTDYGWRGGGDIIIGFGFGSHC